MSRNAITRALLGLTSLFGTLSAQPFEYSADYVIVGAGAGGSVVAARLAEAGKTVILIEAGPDTSLESNDQLVQFDKSLIEIPLNFINLWNRFNQDPNSTNCGNWNATQPLAAFISRDQNGIYYSYPRGVGAGGSVSVHAMQDGVGSLQVYNNIAKVVEDKYWCGKNMKRLFAKMENTLFPHGNDCGSNGWLSIQHTPVEAPFLTDVADSVVSATGVPYIDNFCNPQVVAGIGNSSVQVNADGSRSYVYQDLLVPVMKNTGKIQVFFNTLASEIILEKKSGKNKYKAVGVKAYDKAYLEEVEVGGEFEVVGSSPNCVAEQVERSLPKEAIRFLAKHEVIVCGGAIQTPQLLMLSGIGPKDHLKAVGIKTKVNSPGVGSDLLDHTEMSTIFEIDPLKFIPSYQAHILLGNPNIDQNPQIKAACIQAATNYPDFLNSNTAAMQWDWYSSGSPPSKKEGCYPFPDIHNVPYATFFMNFDLTLAGPQEPFAHCDGCCKDFLIAFSCKGRGICPSCNQRAMVETAAHLIDSVLPRVPFRQFVMSFPKRIRCYLENHKTLQTVLKIVVDEIRKSLIANNRDVLTPHIGAISFIQYFGNTLNYHPHFHIIVADGVFSSEDGLQFHEATLTQDDITDTQEAIQKRVLRYFCNRKFFDKDEMQNMLAYENSGFSLDASVKIPAYDSEALERLIRYCARPPFNSESIQVHNSLINYRFPKPSHDGRLFMTLDPLDFLERISKFIPYPRRHRRHYHGVFAPSSPLRKQVAANAQKRLDTVIKTRQETDEKITKASRTWASLIARIYEVDPLTCISCGKKIKIITFVTHPEHIRRILRGIGWPITIPEFDDPPEEHCDDICQLALNTPDGFSEPEVHVYYETGPDPPLKAYIDPPHGDDISDPPHWED